MNLTESSFKSICELIVLMPRYNIRFPLATFNLLLSFVATVGNTIIIVAVLKSNKLRDQPPTSFIISLSSADVLVGILVQPMLSLYLFDWSPKTCKIEQFKLYVAFFMCSVSICSAMLVCLDKHIRICHPFWYDVHITKKRTLIAVILSWLSGAGVGYISTFNFPNREVVAYGILLWIVTAIFTGIFCSIRIYKVASRQLKEISLYSIDKTKKMYRERKLAISLICVLATITICWLPFAILNLASTYMYTSENWKTFASLHLFAVTLGYVNSTLNIFIFSFKNREVKKAIRKLFGIKHSTKRSMVLPNPSKSLVISNSNNSIKTSTCNNNVSHGTVENQKKNSKE